MTRPVILCLLTFAACSGAGTVVVSDGGGPADGGGVGGGPRGDGPWVAPADHRYCPGSTPYPGAITCLQRSDCPPNPGNPNAPVDCFSRINPYPAECGGAAPRPECEKDLDCGPDQICQLDRCRWNKCRPAPACTPERCEPAGTCMGRWCVWKRCDQPGAAPCQPNWTCLPGPGNADSLGCSPDSCRGGYRCPTLLDCNPGGPRADEHGCALHACKRSNDCACGSCVTGFCLEEPGNCSIISSPP